MNLANGMFRSLSNRNYRLWIGSALVSNIGSWMQATGQDWLVLTQLTHNSAHAVGIVTALQFAPQLLLVPITGTLADRVDRRKLLIWTQAALGALALLLGLFILTGIVQLWHVYVFALLLGCAMAFDAPARQSFVSEMVGEADIGNAVALNSTVFNLARTVGPAISGLWIAAIGTGWVFIVNAASFVATIGGLMAMTVVDLHRSHEGADDGDPAPARGASGLLDGFRYVRNRSDILLVFAMLFLIGSLGFNFPVFISAMSVNIFHLGASEYGFLTSMLAIGAVCGALLSAQRDRPGLGFLICGALLFGLSMAGAAVMPHFLLFGLGLALVGITSQIIITTANGLVQLTIDRAMRGRVMAIHSAVALGGMPLGAPLVGWIADHEGPRWAMAVGSAAGFAATAVGLAWLLRTRRRGAAGSVPGD